MTLSRGKVCHVSSPTLIIMIMHFSEGKSSRYTEPGALRRSPAMGALTRASCAYVLLELPVQAVQHKDPLVDTQPAKKRALI